jgi:hypothetical protein
MAEKNTEALIRLLASQPTVSAAPPAPLWITGMMTCLSFIVMGLASLLVGIRPDHATALRDPVMILELVSVLFTGVTGVLAAHWLGYPDVRQQRWVLALPWVGVAVFLSAVVWRVTMMPPPAGDPHLIHCMPVLLMVSVFPLVMLTLHLRRMATVHGRLSGVVAMLASVCFGYIPARLMCDEEALTHVLGDHVLPVVVLVPLGMLVYRFWRW